MSILSYQKFLNDKSLLEGLREMKFVLSKNLISVLSTINHVISDELMKLHNDLDAVKKQTFVDIHPTRDDSLTFIQANKASNMLDIGDIEKYDLYDKRLLLNIDTSNEVYVNQRTEIGIGRFINLVFGVGTFNVSSTITSEKPSDVESFVRLYKSKYDTDEKFKLMDVLTGSDIAHFYSADYYSSQSRGSLGSSCMSNVDSNFFDIYATNSNVGMLVLFDNESKRKIKGRSIVWKNLILPENRTFMDRIYTNDSSDEELFKEYARKQGWLHKQSQSIGADISVVDTVSNSTQLMRLVSQLRHGGYRKFPYMDTMMFFNPDTGKISNRQREMEYILQSTYGEYEDIDRDDDESEVWSNYHNDDILERDAQWCDIGQDWVLSDDAIRVYNSGNRYAVPGNPTVVKSFIPDFVNKHFLKDRCIWSDYLNTWVFDGSVKKVWTNLEKTESVIDHKKRENTSFVKIGNSYWDIRLAEKIEDGEWVLKD